MFLPLAAALLSTSFTITVADQIPQLNVNPSCHAAAAAAVIKGRTMESCKKDEDDARNRLGQEWDQFAQPHKTRCVQLSTMGGDPSYVELLTCLEMARDVKTLPDHNKDADKIPMTGQGKRSQAK